MRTRRNRKNPAVRTACIGRHHGRGRRHVAKGTVLTAAHLQMPIEELRFTAATYNQLKRQNISTLAQLMHRGERGLHRALRNASKGSEGHVNEIKQVLARRGLQVKYV